jgi:hypothetical protein
MSEIKNVEVIAEETNEVAVPEKKDGIVKKVGNWVKNNWRTVAAVVVGAGLGYAAGAHAAGKSEGCDDVEDDDVIEADDYVVEDVE